MKIHRSQKKKVVKKDPKPQKKQLSEEEDEPGEDPEDSRKPKKIVKKTKSLKTNYNEDEDEQDRVEAEKPKKKKIIKKIDPEEEEEEEQKPKKIKKKIIKKNESDDEEDQQEQIQKNKPKLRQKEKEKQREEEEEENNEEQQEEEEPEESPKPKKKITKTRQITHANTNNISHRKQNQDDNDDDDNNNNNSNDDDEELRAATKKVSKLSVKTNSKSNGPANRKNESPSPTAGPVSQKCAVAGCKQKRTNKGYCPIHARDPLSPVQNKSEDQWSLRFVRTTTSMGMNKNCIEWIIVDKGISHKLELFHSTVGGKRVIKIDGVEKLNEKRPMDNGSRYDIRIGPGGQTAIGIEVRPAGLVGFTYELFVNGRAYDDAKKYWLYHDDNEQGAEALTPMRRLADRE